MKTQCTKLPTRTRPIRAHFCTTPARLTWLPAYRYRGRSSARGNMLFLCILMLGLVIFVGVVGVSLCFLFSSKLRLQYQTETFAMRLSQRLNDSDYVGKMNNLIGHSRELVFTNRQMLSRATEDSSLADLAPLASQVLNESRDGAKLVEQERNRLADVTVTDLRRMIKEQAATAAKTTSFVDVSTVDNVQIGSLKNMVSNVETSKAVPELVIYDAGKGYIQRGKSRDLYRAQTNLRLPSDPDLKFELSPLLAPVSKMTAPSHLTASTELFQRLAKLREDGQDLKSDGRSLTQIPCAVQVRTTMSVKENRGWLESAASALSTACAQGAAPEPE